MSRLSGRGTGARSATSLLSLRCGIAAGRCAPAQVGQDQVLQPDLVDGPGGVADRAAGADQQRALPAGVARRDDPPVGRQAGGIEAGPGQLAVRGEQFPDLAGYLHPRGDEHDQVVADPLQVAYQVRGHHDADLVPGGELRQALQELAPSERVEAGDRLVQDQQLRLLGDGQGQGELGALAAGHLPGPLAGIQAQPLDPVAGQGSVPARVEMGAELEVIGDGEPGVGGRVLRDEADLASCAGPLADLPPRTSIVPDVGTSMPTARFSRVVFPAPFGPTSPTMCPAGMLSVQSVRAWSCRYRLPSPRDSKTAVILLPPW